MNLTEWNDFVKEEDLPQNGVVLIRCSDNVLDTEDWSIFSLTLHDGKVIDYGYVYLGTCFHFHKTKGIEKRKKEEIDLYRKELPDTKAIAKWSELDTTGKHPETYHEVMVLQNCDNKKY